MNESFSDLDHIQFDLPKHQSNVIKVIGVGGGSVVGGSGGDDICGGAGVVCVALFADNLFVVANFVL